MYRSLSYVFGLGALLMLVACGDGKKKSENAEKASSTASETNADGAPAEVKTDDSGTSEHVSEGTTATPKDKVQENVDPVKESKRKTVSDSAEDASKEISKNETSEQAFPRDSKSLTELIDAPIDDVSEDESVSANESSASRSSNQENEDNVPV